MTERTAFVAWNESPYHTFLTVRTLNSTAKPYRFAPPICLQPQFLDVSPENVSKSIQGTLSLIAFMVYAESLVPAGNGLVILLVPLI